MLIGYIIPMLVCFIWIFIAYKFDEPCCSDDSVSFLLFVSVIPVLNIYTAMGLTLIIGGFLTLVCFAKIYLLITYYGEK